MKRGSLKVRLYESGFLRLPFEIKSDTSKGQHLSPGEGESVFFLCHTIIYLIPCRAL